LHGSSHVALHQAGEHALDREFIVVFVRARHRRQQFLGGLVNLNLL
jgi:molybdopterin synthase catalytic subunit